MNKIAWARVVLIVFTAHQTTPYDFNAWNSRSPQCIHPREFTECTLGIHDNGADVLGARKREEARPLF